MDVTTTYTDKTESIAAMFHASFAASEGSDEGRLIKDLVTDMLTSCAEGDLRVFSAVEGDAVVASILFSRMTFSEDTRTVFILSPVAVSPLRQGQGFGQGLIQHGLRALRADGVEIVLTYGDINFYAKVGFSQISEKQATPPHPLQFPHGWLGQSLSQKTWPPLRGASQCVPPLNNPHLW